MLQKHEFRNKRLCRTGIYSHILGMRPYKKECQQSF